MSNYSTYFDPTETEETCAASSFTLQDLTKMLLTMKRRLEFAEEEIKELKKAQKYSAVEKDILKTEEVPVFPILNKPDLLEFLEEEKTISCLIFKHKWPVKIKGKLFFVFESDDWILSTDKNEKVEQFTEKIRTVLRSLCTTHIDDKHDKYHLYCMKIMNFKAADVKRALKTKHKTESDA